MRSMTLRSTSPPRPASSPAPASSSRTGRRTRSTAICRDSSERDEAAAPAAAKIGRRETLLGGAAAAAATVAMPASKALAIEDGTTQSPSPLTPATDGSVAFNCTPREQPVRLGRSDLFVTPLAVGAWSWGDKTAYWGYSSDENAEFGRKQCLEAFNASLDSGITFLDTAEAYGFGASEELIASFSRERGDGAHPVIATKFAPLPWRGRGGVLEGAKRSLARLQMSRLGL